MARKAYPVVVDLHRHADGLHVRSAKVVCDGREIPSQADALNGDFRADELAFTADIPAQGEAVYQIHYFTTVYTAIILPEATLAKHALT